MSAESKESFVAQRLQSLDAYRGLIMVALAFQAFGLLGVAKNHLKDNPSSSFWNAIAYQTEHTEWLGCGFWDLIQPSFMFMVGVSMPYSYAGRKKRGDTSKQMLGHAIRRSFVLIFLGIFLISNFDKRTSWFLTNVLTQIGLAYTFLFLLWDRSFRVQSIAAVVLLVGTWLLYVTYPSSGVNMMTGSPEVGIRAEWAQQNLTGVDPAWHKNANVGHAIEVQVLNQFPRDTPFIASTGGYALINFIPSLVTMLFGMMIGEWLRSQRSGQQKAIVMAVCGFGALLVGELLEWTGICPVIKRIWTPSWAVYSTGWCLLILSMLYVIIDLGQYRRWAFPLLVVGMNSIAIYCMSMILKPWTGETWKRHFGPHVFDFAGPMWEPMVRSTMIGLAFWMICYVMYRQKIFVRV